MKHFNGGWESLGRSPKSPAPRAGWASIRRWRTLLLLGAACGGWPAALAESAAVVVSTPLVNRLIDEADAHNRGLLAARARAEAARLEVAAVKRWQNPELMAGGMAARKMMRQDDGDLMLGVGQPLPLFGKEGAARGAALAAAKLTAAEADLEFQTLRKEVAQAVVGLALADETLGFARRDLAWLETIEKVIQERFALGASTQLDVLKVRNELTRARERATTLAGRRVDAAALLNRLLGRGTHDVVEEFALPEPGPPVPAGERVFTLASANDPRVKLAQAAAGAAAARVKVAERERRPDASLEVAGRSYSGTGDFRAAEVVVKFSLPWLNRSSYNAMAAGARHGDKAAQFDLEEAVRETREEIQLLLTLIDSARREALAYRDEIIPRSEQALRLAEQFWPVGKAELRDVLESGRMLVEARTRAAEAIADQHRRLSELILCCGLGDLDALEMITHSPDSTTP